MRPLDHRCHAAPFHNHNGTEAFVAICNRQHHRLDTLRDGNPVFSQTIVPGLDQFESSTAMKSALAIIAFTVAVGFIFLMTVAPEEARQLASLTWVGR